MKTILEHFPVSGNYFKLQQINFEQLLTPNILDLVNVWLQIGASWLYLRGHCLILVLLLDQTAVMHAEGLIVTSKKVHPLMKVL